MESLNNFKSEANVNIVVDRTSLTNVNTREVITIYSKEFNTSHFQYIHRKLHTIGALANYF